MTTQPEAETPAGDPPKTRTKPWSEQELQTLHDAPAKRMSWAEVAAATGRTLGAVATKARKLHIREVTGDPEPSLAELSIRITPPGLDPEHLMLAGVDTSARPLYAVGEVAKLFGISTHWIRWRERILRKAGRQVGSRTASDARVYDLAQVEQLTYALADSGYLTGMQAANILGAVYYVARIYGYLGDDLPVPVLED